MKNLSSSSTYTVQAGIIAALYTSLTYLSSFLGIAYGPIQFRLSEILTILPIFTPAAIPGLTIGRLLGNINSPFGIFDIVFGTVATFIAAVFSRITRNLKIKNLPVLSTLMPVIFNALFVGIEIAAFSSSKSKFAIFAISAAEVALGEFVVCCIFGLVFYVALSKIKTGIFDLKSQNIKF